MDKKDCIVVTGAAGFIGSCMVQYLNEQGYFNLLLVDDFGVEKKRNNWEGKQFSEVIERHYFLDWVKINKTSIACIIHLGARTDTTEFDYSIHQHLNVDYTTNIWNYCVEHQIPLIYASSAATYGNGELGYNDNHEIVEKLDPLNPYGRSKNEIDKWILQQKETPPFWAGLKFFNVYGPNENHKDRMASVIWHSFHQIKKNGVVNLFKSHKANFKDGEQLRDFVYVKDVIKVIYWMMHHQTINSGLYNLGTGKARSFNDLVKATFAGINQIPVINYINMPEDIRDKYQYFTEANMNKLKEAGYNENFYSLEDGVKDYVKKYLIQQAFY